MWRRVLPPFVDRFVANSEFGARRLRESGVPVHKIRCIKNAIVSRTSVGDEELEAAEIVGRQRTVLCVGQIAPFKGPHVLLDAAEMLIEYGRDFHVAFLGLLAHLVLQIALLLDPSLPFSRPMQQTRVTGFFLGFTLVTILGSLFVQFFSARIYNSAVSTVAAVAVIVVIGFAIDLITRARVQRQAQLLEFEG
jgi:glycosyltransferase involved in cell wall biosynthesis